MRKAVLAALLLLLLAPVGAARAETPTAADRLAALAGTWQGAGTWLGKPSRVEARWTLTLSGAFVRHDYDVSAAGGAAFAGTAFYRSGASGPGAATWFDSQGSVHPIETMVDGDTLIALWGPAGGPVGKTHYRVAGERLIIEDWIRGKDGGWRSFSRSELGRRP